jgi:hypothetical protein
MIKTVYTYDDSTAIGEIEMTDKQFATYIAESDDVTGTILFSDLMAYGLDYTASEIVPGDTTVYVGDN